MRLACCRPSVARRQQRSRFLASRASLVLRVARSRVRLQPWRRGVRLRATARACERSWRRTPTRSFCRVALSCAAPRPATRCRRSSRTCWRTGMAAATAAATRPSASGASPRPRWQSTHRRRARMRSRPWTRCTHSSPRTPTPSSCRRVSHGPHSHCPTSLAARRLTTASSPPSAWQAASAAPRRATLCRRGCTRSRSTGVGSATAWPRCHRRRHVPHQRAARATTHRTRRHAQARTRRHTQSYTTMHSHTHASNCPHGTCIPLAKAHPDCTPAPCSRRAP